MKRLVLSILLGVFAAAVIAGCAHDAYYAAVKAQADAYAVVERARYDALSKVAGTDPTSNVAVAFAVAMRGSGGSAEGLAPIKPPRDGWDYAAMIADRLLTVGGVAYSAKVAGDVAMTSARFQAEERSALYGTFSSANAGALSAIRDVSVGGFGALRETAVAGLSRPPSNSYSFTANGGRDANAGYGNLTSSNNVTTTDNHGSFLPCPAGTLPAPGGGCVKL